MTALHETIAEMLRPLANDINEELSIRQIQEFIQYEEVDAIDLLTKLVEKVRLKMKAIQSEHRKAIEEKLVVLQQSNNEFNSQERFLFVYP